MSSLNTLKGLGACGVSTLLFGSMFVPVKQQNPGDGFFVQWIMDSAIFMFGMLINVYTGFPKFYPLAMLGGMFWAIGNATAIPILQSIGLGMGMLLWNVTNCLCGWASSRFGLFGLKANAPKNSILNYAGLALIIFGGAIFSTVKPTPKTDAGDDESTVKKRETDACDESTAIKVRSDEPKIAEDSTLLKDSQQTNVTSLKQRIFGIVLALIAGSFYGLTFVPVIYIQEHPDKFPGAPADALPYVFAHFTGVFVTGTVILLVYAIGKVNKPFVNNQVILPAYLSGTMWAVAQSSWFIANDYIEQSISFPINSMVPGVVGALWSVVYFREVRGARNLRVLTGAMILTIIGAVMVGLSKDL